MKKISGIIAMVLVLMMLAISFSGCTLLLPWIFGGSMTAIYIGIGLDVALLFIWIFSPLFDLFTEAPSEAETQIYLAGAEYTPLPQVYSLMERINSLPEAERDSVMERFYSLPAAKRASLIDTVYSIPETEIASSAERLSALSDEELIFALRDFSALSDADFDVLKDKLNERARFLTATVAAADVPKERGFMALSLAY